VTPIGRFALPGNIFAEFDAVARELPPGRELDDVPVLQRLARRDALAGVMAEAEFFDVGVPEGYREAVAAFPPRTAS
jgi:UTP-glucose-1-phosphate uridylyltransferase